MLRKYFYAKFLDLYLCYQMSEDERSKCLHVDDERDIDKDRVAFWEADAAKLMAQIRTVKYIAADLIGKETALDVKGEARQDAHILRENKLYWIPDDTREVIDVMQRYASNTEITSILTKLIGGLPE